MNKVNSKVTVQVNLNTADWISESTKEKLRDIVSEFNEFNSLISEFDSIINFSLSLFIGQ